MLVRCANLLRWRSSGLLVWLVGCCALGATGCANCRIPRIDPTGERLFVPANAPGTIPLPQGGAMPPGGLPPGATIPALPPAGQYGISVSPSQVIAPVGSEVVMIATVMGPEGYPLTREKVEWQLAPDGAGQFLSPGQRASLDFFGMIHGYPKKVDTHYVINKTLTGPQTLDRGTPTPTDDLIVQEGQSWVTVSSPTEGTSRVTVFGPRVQGWDRRQQTASIYWIDAQWRFPSPAITAAGNPSPLTTVVTRQTDNSPLVGWIVRYEIAGGPEAGFAPDGAAAVEIMTGPTGEARAEVVQRQPVAGTNQVNIQVIRPAGPAGQGRPLPIGSGSTLQTWTSTDLTLRANGPTQATVGQNVTYRLEAQNPASSPMRDVVVTEQAPRGLEFVESNPPASTGAGGRQWQLAEVPPGRTALIEATYRVSEPGAHNFCATMSVAGGPSSRACTMTMVPVSGGPTAEPPIGVPPVVVPPTTGEPSTTPPASDVPATAPQLQVSVAGPTTVVVGNDVRFDIQVVNRGTTPATQLLVHDRFDAGLDHARAVNTIEHDLSDLAPGAATQLSVTFHVSGAGQLCQEITVTAAGGGEAKTRHCVTSIEGSGAVPGLPPQPLPGQPTPAQPIQPGAEPTPAQPPSAEPQAETPTTPSTQLTVTKKGPSRKVVGETALFTIEVTNHGQTPIENFEIADNFEISLEPARATDGWVWLEGNALGWKIDSLPAGRTIRREVELRCLRETPKACNRVTVSGPGLESLADEACLEIVAADTSAPATTPPVTPTPSTTPPAAKPSQLTVSVVETADPIRINGLTTCQVLVTNKGAESVFDLELTAKFSDELRLEGISGPEKGAVSSGIIRFAPIREVRAGENITYELKFKGMSAGTAKLRVDAISRGQTKPVSTEQTTEVLP